MREGFLAEAQRLGDRCTLVDTTRSPEEVAAAIIEVADTLWD